MKKGYVLLATGFEETEALTQVDFLRRAGMEVMMLSATGELLVTGAHQITVKADLLLDGIEDTADLIMIPGGMPGAENLRGNAAVIDLVKKHDAAGKCVAAICAGPIVLEEAGLLDDRKYTCFPGFEDKIKAGTFEKAPVVVDENIITARGPIYAQDLAFALTETLLGEEKKKKLREETLADEDLK